MEGKDIQENKAIAAIGYLGILFLVPLLAKKDSPFAQYHAKQGMVLFIADVIWTFCVWIFAWISVFGRLIITLGWLFILVLLILGLVNALSGKTQPLPVIGKFAEKFKI